MLITDWNEYTIAIHTAILLLYTEYPADEIQINFDAMIVIAVVPNRLRVAKIQLKILKTYQK